MLQSHFQPPNLAKPHEQQLGLGLLLPGPFFSRARNEARVLRSRGCGLPLPLRVCAVKQVMEKVKRMMGLPVFTLAPGGAVPPPGGLPHVQQQPALQPGATAAASGAAAAAAGAAQQQVQHPAGPAAAAGAAVAAPAKPESPTPAPAAAAPGAPKQNLAHLLAAAAAGGAPAPGAQVAGGAPGIPISAPPAASPQPGAGDAGEVAPAPPVPSATLTAPMPAMPEGLGPDSAMFPAIYHQQVGAWFWERLRFHPPSLWVGAGVPWRVWCSTVRYLAAVPDPPLSPQATACLPGSLHIPTKPWSTTSKAALCPYLATLAVVKEEQRTFCACRPASCPLVLVSCRGPASLLPMPQPLASLAMPSWGLRACPLTRLAGRAAPAMGRRRQLAGRKRAA